MKSYFMYFEFYSDKQNFNKFSSGVVEIDLKKDLIIDVAKGIIKKEYPDFDLNDVEIKVVAFNNIN